MFAGIDPDGLIGLGDELAFLLAEVRRATGPTLSILDHNRRHTHAATIDAELTRIDSWGWDTVRMLQWRAATIRAGQHRGPAINLSGFAGKAVFTAETRTAALARWTGRLGGRPEQVAGAIADIGRWLDQRWNDWDVTNNDLHNIQSALQTLSRRHLNDVLEGLTDRQLDRWFSEMSHGGNGFSRRETQAVLDTLAAGVSGHSLVRVHRAILQTGVRATAIDLGMAIGANSSDREILAFTRGALATGGDIPPHAGIAPALAAAGLDQSAAIDTLLEIVTDTEGAFALMAVDGLAAAHVEDTGSSCLPIDPLGSLITTLRRGTEPEGMALVLVSLVRLATSGTEATVEGLWQRYDGRTKERTSPRNGNRELLRHASRLFASDADRIVEELATIVDPDGAATTDLLFGLIDSGQIDGLGTLVAELRGGSVVDAVRFSEAGTNPAYEYPHAQNLGFIAGSLRRALERYAAEAQADISKISLLAQALGSLAALGYETSLKSLQLIGGAIGFGIENLAPGDVAAETNDAIDRHLERLLKTIETSMQPQRSPTPTPPRLGDAMWAWDDRYGIVLGR